jgi:uncharacterized membrane protein HdeD (DUF308 family)
MQSTSLTNATGVIFILLGLLSITYPFYSSVGIEILFGALFLVGGIFHLFGSSENTNRIGYLWNFCVGVLYILAGVYLLSHPVLGLLALTFILISLFFAQGIMIIIFAFQQRKFTKNWVWALFSGLLTLSLGTILLISYPISSLWAFGILTGINLLFFGVSILMINRIIVR